MPEKKSLVIWRKCILRNPLSLKWQALLPTICPKICTLHNTQEPYFLLLKKEKKMLLEVGTKCLQMQGLLLSPSQGLGLGLEIAGLAKHFSWPGIISAYVYICVLPLFCYRVGCLFFEAASFAVTLCVSQSSHVGLILFGWFAFATPYRFYCKMPKAQRRKWQAKQTERKWTLFCNDFNCFICFTISF